MTERKPHKWKKVITAWANGFPIQFKLGSFSEWTDYDPEALKRSNISSKYFPFYIPRFDLDFEWRIKPGQTIYRCPKFNKGLDFCREKFCPNCGKKIDWSDYE